MQRTTIKTRVADDPSRDFRAAFRSYVNQGRHLSINGTPKSFHAIADALGRNHSRVAAWMAEDFPAVAAAIQDRKSMDLYGYRPRSDFRAYIERGEHLNADGTPRRRQEIAKEFGVSFRSVTGWLRSEFPEGTPAYPWLRAAR